MGYVTYRASEGRARADCCRTRAVALLGAAAQVLAGVGAAFADRAGLRVGLVEQGGRGAGGGVAADGGQVAGTVLRVAAGWSGRRSATGPAGVDHSRSGGGRGGS